MIGDIVNNCLECGKFTKNEKFCGSSCAAKYNNRERPRKRNMFCRNCGKPLFNTRSGCCNQACDAEYKKNKRIKEWINGEWNASTGSGASKTVLRFLLEQSNYKCSRCGWGEINPSVGHPILDIHHKDGNRKNNFYENLEVLCPNCHSLTETYRALNIKKINNKHAPV